MSREVDFATDVANVSTQCVVMESHWCEYQLTADSHGIEVMHMNCKSGCLTITGFPRSFLHPSTRLTHARIGHDWVL